MKATITILLWFGTFLALTLPVSAQGPPDPFLRWMDQIAQQQLRERDASIAAIHTMADAEKRKAFVRAKLLEILGGLPDYSGPLNARMTGHIQADGYVIEKLLFESLPKFYVTANVYRPNRPGRYPAVLLQSGHTLEGKAEPQVIAANLALKGFVVLCFDPIGQGERVQSFDRQIGRSVSIHGANGNDHVQIGAQSMLVGESSARYFIWDAKRALDYLLSRPDVDATHAAAVGCSGGGALTTFIGALDPRLKAAAPGCFINSYKPLFAGPDPDSEMSFPRFLVSRLDTADFLELPAPMPWLILATEGDYYSPPGAKMVYDEVRRWYKLYGAEDKVRFFVGSGPHGTPIETREAIYEWMVRWLKDGHGDFFEREVKQYPNYELLATKTGQVEDEPGSRKVYQVILDEYHAKKHQGTPAELVTELQSLRVPTDGSAPAVKVVKESPGPEFHIQQIEYESEPGIELKGALYIPNSPGRKPAVVMISDEVSSRWIYSTDALAEMFAKMGRVVLELEPRDSPEQRPSYSGRSPACFVCVERLSFTGNWLEDLRADLIGRNLPAMRAHDILRGVDLLAARSDVDPAAIRGTARGLPGIWMLMAAAADPRIGKVWLDRTPYSIRAALENSVNTNLFDAVIPGFALRWDLDDLSKAMGSRSVFWTDPMNWNGEVAPLGPPYQFRFVLGDNNDLRDDLDTPYIEAFIK
jgi:dienelactone hydrolase